MPAPSRLVELVAAYSRAERLDNRVPSGQRVPSWSRARRGSRAAARAGRLPRRPASSASSQARTRSAHERAAEVAKGLAWQGPPRPAVRERQRRPFVVGARHQGRERLCSDPARPGAVAGVPGGVMDAGAGSGAEEGDVVGRDVDRSAPRPLDPNVIRARDQPAQAGGGAKRRRPVAREARVQAAPEADRARAAPHEDPAVGRRSEVMEEHARVADGLAARPADLLEELGHGLGQDDVAPEVREPAPERPPARQGRVRREHDLIRTDSAAHQLEHVRLAGADVEDARALV